MSCEQEVDVSLTACLGSSQPCVRNPMDAVQGGPHGGHEPDCALQVSFCGLYVFDSPILLLHRTNGTVPLVLLWRGRVLVVEVVPCASAERETKWVSRRRRPSTRTVRIVLSRREPQLGKARITRPIFRHCCTHQHRASHDIAL